MPEPSDTKHDTAHTSHNRCFAYAQPRWTLPGHSVPRAAMPELHVTLLHIAGTTRNRTPPGHSTELRRFTDTTLDYAWTGHRRTTPSRRCSRLCRYPASDCSAVAVRFQTLPKLGYALASPKCTRPNPSPNRIRIFNALLRFALPLLYWTRRGFASPTPDRAGRCFTWTLPAIAPPHNTRRRLDETRHHSTLPVRHRNVLRSATPKPRFAEQRLYCAPQCSTLPLRCPAVPSQHPAQRDSALTLLRLAEPGQALPQRHLT